MERSMHLLQEDGVGDSAEMSVRIEVDQRVLVCGSHLLHLLQQTQNRTQTAKQLYLLGLVCRLPEHCCMKIVWDLITLLIRILVLCIIPVGILHYQAFKSFQTEPSMPTMLQYGSL